MVHGPFLAIVIIIEFEHSTTFIAIKQFIFGTFTVYGLRQWENTLCSVLSVLLNICTYNDSTNPMAPFSLSFNVSVSTMEFETELGTVIDTHVSNVK